MTTIVTWCQTNMYQQLRQLTREDVQIPPLETPRELTPGLTLTSDGIPLHGAHIYITFSSHTDTHKHSHVHPKSNGICYDCMYVGYENDNRSKTVTCCICVLCIVID